MVTKIEKFIADDGTEFETFQEAVDHDRKMALLHAKSFQAFLKSYSFERLEKLGYGLDDVHTWMVRGENSNWDLGGAHHQPKLGVVRGKLRNAIGWAVKQEGWFTWGGGGTIEPHDTKIIDV